MRDAGTPENETKGHANPNRAVNFVFFLSFFSFYNAASPVAGERKWSIWKCNQACGGMAFQVSALYTIATEHVERRFTKLPS